MSNRLAIAMTDFGAGRSSRAAIESEVRWRCFQHRFPTRTSGQRGPSGVFHVEHCVKSLQAPGFRKGTPARRTAEVFHVEHSTRTNVIWIELGAWIPSSAFADSRQASGQYVPRGTFLVFLYPPARSASQEPMFHVEHFADFTWGVEWYSGGDRAGAGYAYSGG
jgi:hypothetical protein